MEPQDQVNGLRAFPSLHKKLGTCRINIDSVSESFNRPFLIEANRREVLYPELINGVRVITVSSGTALIVACPGTRNAFTLTNDKSMDVTCYDGQLVSSSDSQVFEYDELGCSRRPRASLNQAKNSKCGQNGSRYNIGWNIMSNIFIPLVHLCFDAEKEATEFTFHKIQGRSIDHKIVDSSRPSFHSGGMFTADVGNIYKKRSQKALFKELLHTYDHLSGQGQHFLARGHLAPDSDFFWAAEQDATYLYGNVVPQWQAFNNGNWKRLEFAIRELAEKHMSTFEVWTGSYGTLQMPDANNNFISIFLGLTEGKRLVPVPFLLWKVIYDPSLRQAVAVVSINEVRGDGMAEEVDLMESPCPDICNQITWIDWDTQDVRRGRTFCCHVGDLRATISSVPTLGNVDLLAQ
ncbi:hypothetical protein SK128_008222 [Halocaridina rubra]|uniref:DNA/RNA non-specific endonuclease/pyrophosphatase/phosphodiesterase domain-containing protein n=1 Tax=Halocaridina rubra TaxID=373956 RepID=A0AAN8XSX6_HALRR